MKYSNECKKTGVATEGYINSIGYASEGNKAPKMMDTSIMEGIAGGPNDMIVSTPAKKSPTYTGVNLGIFDGINFDGSY